ncbi:hypothetical protein JCM3766R1_003768 [Sporobolomyces carnicolor]
MALPLSTPYDLSAVQQFLSSNASNLAQSSQDQVAIAGDDTAGMSFSELFSHYLAPEVAKLPNSSNSNSLVPSFSDAAFTFGASSGGAAQSSTSDFDPSTFLPNLPGSPISPSETGSLSHSAASPMSFADFDDMFNPATAAASTENDPFALDPSVFDQSVAGVSLPALEQPSSFSTEAPLPPLPDVSSLSTGFDLPVPPPPPHSHHPAPSDLAPSRPKRNVSSMMIPEEDDEEEDVEVLLDEDQDEDDGSMSDSSERTTTRRRSSRPPSTKKTRSNSSKKLARTSVLPLASEALYKTSSKSNLPPVPQWKDKPDEEEYKKLSSKEKRQLRNKISARNFRHRRKEYITTLEEEISTRDSLITNLQDQVSTLKTDNSSLKSEVTLLKTKWQELLDKMSSLAETPSGATSAVGLGVNPQKALAGAAAVQVKEEEETWALDSPSSSVASPRPASASTDEAAATTRRTRSSNGIQRPNLSKDVAPSRRSNSTSWRHPQAFGQGSGFQSVHTTLVPDFSSLASHLTHKASPPQPLSFNPNLNNLTRDQLDELPSLTSHLRSPTSTTTTNPPQAGQSRSAFQDLFSTNPFYLNQASLEQQRAGLYSRIAHNSAGIAQAKKLQQQQQPGEGVGGGPLPLPNGFRPAFFSPSSSSSKSSTTRELVEFQSPSSASSLVPRQPSSHQEAYEFKLAQIASETLLSKMTGAFLNAFSGGGGGSTSTSSTASWDHDKVKDVIAGRATLQVVPVATSQEHKKGGLEALESRMGSLNLSSSSTTTSSSSRRARSLSPSPSSSSSKSCSFDEVVNRWTIRSESGAAPPPPAAGGPAKR